MIRFSPVRDPFISAAALQIHKALNDNGRINAAFGRAMATAIAYRIAVGGPPGVRSREAESVRLFAAHQLTRIEGFIEEYLDRSITVTELAGLVGLSNWHFARRFTTTGCRPAASLSNDGSNEHRSYSPHPACQLPRLHLRLE